MGALRDIRNQLKPEIALEPQDITTNTTTVGEIIDTKDYDGGIMFTMLINHTSGTFTPLLQEGDESDLSDAAAVDDANLIGDTKTGQEADAALTSAQLISSLGVVNNTKRYLRLSIVSTGISGSNYVAATVHKYAEIMPITN